jgi:hypothetical protein
VKQLECILELPTVMYEPMRGSDRDVRIKKSVKQFWNVTFTPRAQQTREARMAFGAAGGAVHAPALESEPRRRLGTVVRDKGGIPVVPHSSERTLAVCTCPAAAVVLPAVSNDVRPNYGL